MDGSRGAGFAKESWSRNVCLWIWVVKRDVRKGARISRWVTGVMSVKTGKILPGKGGRGETQQKGESHGGTAKGGAVYGGRWQARRRRGWLQWSESNPGWDFHEERQSCGRAALKEMDAGGEPTLSAR